MHGGKGRAIAVKRLIAGICRGAALMVAGAWALAFYLAYVGLTDAVALDGVRRGLQIAFVVLAMAVAALQPSSPPDLSEPSPRRIATAVVVSTGWAAAFAIWWSGSLMLATVIAMTTLAVAASVWRFATANGNTIGEARFGDRPTGR